MKKVLVVVPLIITCLVFGLVLLGFSQNELTKEMNSYVNIAINTFPDLKDLKENKEAYSMLPKAIIHYSRHKWIMGAAISDEEKAYYILSQLKTYAMLIEKYPKSRAVLIAKFLMADAILRNDLDDKYNNKSRKILDSIISQYPSTFEAALANSRIKNYFNASMDERIKSIEDLLPWAKKLDNENSLYPRTLQIIILRTGKDELYPYYLLALASLYESPNDIEKARSIYNQIIKDYPNTRSAEDAQGFIDMLNEGQ